MIGGALKTFGALLQEVPNVVPPRFIGIYFLLTDNEIVYVGQSTDVPQRIAAHKVRRHHHVERWRMIWDRALWMPVGEADLDAYEGALIRRLTPRYNTSAPSDDSRDQEICDLLKLPAPDLARLAEFRARRHESFVAPAAKRSSDNRERQKMRARFTRQYGQWIADPWVRTRRIRARHLWRAVKSLLAEQSREAS